MGQARLYVSMSPDGVIAVVTGSEPRRRPRDRATVYVTARSVRGAPSAPGRPGGCVEETEEEVRRRGGPRFRFAVITRSTRMSWAVRAGAG